jgi:hypothetical protein
MTLKRIRSEKPLIKGGISRQLLVRPTQNEQRNIRLLSWRTRPIVQRIKCISSVVYTMVCLCSRLWRIALVKNHSMVNVTRSHGCSVSAQRFPLRSCPLPLHGAIFHPCLCFFSWLWPRASSAWAVRLEVDRPRNNHWRLGPLLHSGDVSRSVSAKRLRGLTNR